MDIKILDLDDNFAIQQVEQYMRCNCNQKFSTYVSSIIPILVFLIRQVEPY